MAWLYLLVAGLLEISWAIGLKYTDGFRRPLATFVTIVLMIASFYMLSLAIRTLPIGTGYAVWTGIGAFGTAVLGMILFHEPASLLRISCLILIVAGTLGLKWSSAE